MMDSADYRIGNPGNDRIKKVRNDFSFQTLWYLGSNQTESLNGWFSFDEPF